MEKLIYDAYKILNNTICTGSSDFALSAVQFKLLILELYIGRGSVGRSSLIQSPLGGGGGSVWGGVH